MKYFLISTLVLLSVGCATGKRESVRPTDKPVRIWTDALRSSTDKNSYRVNIRVKNTEFTGICLLKKDSEGWRGAVMNDFGAKAFDFTITSQGCRLLHIIPQLDKWYIRRAMASDLHFLFAVDDPASSFQKKIIRRLQPDQTPAVSWGRKKTLVRRADGTLILENRAAHRTVYMLQKIED